MSTHSPPPEANSLFEAIRQSAGAGLDGLHFHTEDGVRTLSPVDAVREGERMARWLVGLGVSPGDRVGLLGPNKPEWAVAAVALWRIGATLVPMPYPLMGSTAGLRERTRVHCETVGARLVLADPSKMRAVPPGLGVSWDDVQDVGNDLPPLPGPDDLAVIQLSSGSTGQPKGIMLPHGSVLASIWSTTESLPNPTDERIFVGWLPFFHDFGLFAFVVRPLCTGIETHLMTLEQFAADPVDWWRLVGEVGATYTGGAPSAWAITARLAEKNPDGIDLSSLESCSMGAEMISVETVEYVQGVAGKFGLAPGIMFGGYGLAEATLGVSGITGDRIRVDEISLDRYTKDDLATPAVKGEATKQVVSCGRAFAGMEIRIVRDGAELGEREVGEIQVKSPSLMRGYVGTDQPDPFVDGWLRTGDLGYLVDGELFVTGRIKDIIIVMGCNFPAQDLEWAAGSVRGVRPGRCIAFSKPGPDDGSAVVLIELSRDAEPKAVTAAVKEAITDKVGGFPLEVVAVPRGTIQKTTSGKLRRSAMRAAYEAGEISAVEPEPVS